ncbi:hypothetical protein GUJ93_ZPchr0009g1078 [Zizania palustris]|uniref:Uncharacterized protein n=1 Tax=Zizania palustris TaxID=103762 RepID=A0A8J5VKR1_ZIZPA|nr:hypothetical protein GUJ93_ZPchr0009g1078 [Zizania palustris]
MFCNALTCVGLASIPRLETRYPSSFPARASKTHFSGLRRIPHRRRLSKVSAMSALWRSLTVLLITISSMYASILRPI